ncbi:hypothetical protein [Croceicoccus sp. YJ47]|nr:hypothetical protein [Croceicoccus sp. YJ47]
MTRRDDRRLRRQHRRETGAVAAALIGLLFLGLYLIIFEIGF